MEKFIILKLLKKLFTTSVIKSSGDTEVIIQLFENFKEDTIKLLNGMFSIGVYII